MVSQPCQYRFLHTMLVKSLRKDRQIQIAKYAHQTEVRKSQIMLNWSETQKPHFSKFSL